MVILDIMRKAGLDPLKNLDQNEEQRKDGRRKTNKKVAGPWNRAWRTIVSI